MKLNNKTLDFCKYLENCLNSALDLNGETTRTNSFRIIFSDNGFYFVPLMPAVYVLDKPLYDKIFSIAVTALYPYYTVLVQDGLNLVQTGKEVNNARGFFFPFIKGVPERLQIDDLDEFFNSLNLEQIPLMKNLNFSLNSMTHMAIAGNSGSGKSYFLNYLLEAFRIVADLDIIDPKIDDPARFADRHGLPSLVPTRDSANSEFISNINELLANNVALILERQEQRFNDPSRTFKHKVIVIDELLSISSLGSKKLVDEFFSLLLQISLLGRSVQIHLVLVSQRFDAKALPTAVRAQLSLIIQIGVISQETTQFLFDNVNTGGMAIPTGKGTGIVKIIDAQHSDNVMPMLTPTYC